MKKGNISLQVVVVAAVCLLVLVILSVIFASRMAGFHEGLRYCDTVCVAKAQECEQEGYSMPLFWSNCEDDQGNKFKDSAYCCSQKKT
jgi:hypothetical protein